MVSASDEFEHIASKLEYNRPLQSSLPRESQQHMATVTVTMTHEKNKRKRNVSKLRIKSAGHNSSVEAEMKKERSCEYSRSENLRHDNRIDSESTKRWRQRTNKKSLRGRESYERKRHRSELESARVPVYYRLTQILVRVQRSATTTAAALWAEETRRGVAWAVPSRL